MLMAANVRELKRPYRRRFLIVENDNHTELLSKVARARCQSSFNKIFETFAPKVYSYGVSNGLTSAQSKDLVQEVMSRVWFKAHLFQADKGEAKTWIFTLSRNVRFDLLRKSARDARALSSEDLYSTLAQKVVDPNADIETSQEKQELHRFVDRLSVSQKDAIKQVYFSGLTQEEYSQSRQIPLGTVKSRIRLAIRKLNHFMEGL